MKVRAGARTLRDKLLRCLSAGLNYDKQIKRPAARTKCGLVEAPGVEPGSEDRRQNGMGMITQPQWWSAQAQVRGGLLGRECFGHQFLR